MNNIEWKHGKPELDCLNGYESPVTVYYEETSRQISDFADGQIMAEIRMHVDVDKDELIKAINYDRDQYEKGFINGVLEGWKPAWTPASEPPERDDVYLVYAPGYFGGSSSTKENHKGIMFSAFKNGKWSIEHGYYKRPGCVRAWMPLPEPYREDV